MTLSWIYALWGGGGLVAGLSSLKAGVLAIVAQAVLRLAKRALKTRAQRALAVAAFVGLFALALPFPLIVAAAALIGVLGGLIAPAAFAPGGHGAAGGPATPMPKRFWRGARRPDRSRAPRRAEGGRRGADAVAAAGRGALAACTRECLHRDRAFFFRNLPC
ncbi:hypothetical protein [Rhodobacter capsulatus]|uniref:hypothetical protein n=1 Tax=Rhodobacter capsulatus TaxID=1061 RepID=UPI004025431A